MSYSLNHETLKNIEAVYGSDAVKLQTERYSRIAETLCESYKAKEEDIIFVSAPGRCEIIGNHTDHQCGCVITGAVSCDAVAAAASRDDFTVNVNSLGYEPISLSLSSLAPEAKERNTAASLIRGVAAYCARCGFTIGGFDAAVSSDVLKGSGLSSSAAFEVLICEIFSRLYNGGEIDAVKRALIAQGAENEFFGKPCGLEDQLACSLGGVSFIDFYEPQDPKYDKLDFDINKYGYSLCVTDTGGSHADLTDEYGAMPREMEQIAAFFGADKLRRVDEDAFYTNIGALRGKVSDRAILRAHHFFGENKRPERALKALKAGNFTAFLDEVRASGRSSYMYLQNVYPPGAIEEQNVALALALSERLLESDEACRIQGGGFAGTVIAFVKNENVASYKKGMEAVFGANAVNVLTVRAAGAVKL